LQPPESGKAFILGTITKFFAQRSQQPKNEEKNKFFFYLLIEQDGIHSVQQDEVPKIRVILLLGAVSRAK